MEDSIFSFKAAGFLTLVVGLAVFEETQTTLKWAILVLLLALIVWAKNADD